MKVGDTVVAIEDHEDGYFKKGEVFTILDTQFFCKCCPFVLDIGLKLSKNHFIGCDDCDFDMKKTKTLWCHPERFVLIQNIQYKQVTFKEIQEPAICAN